MDSNEHALEVQAELHGLRIVVTLMASSMPPQADLIGRLAVAEKALREQNALARTIEVVRQVRQVLEG